MPHRKNLWELLKKREELNRGDEVSLVKFPRDVMFLES
jgi:hypothetical protein